MYYFDYLMALIDMMSSDFLKTIPQFVLPKKFLTLLAGCLANVTNAKVKNFLIQHFIKQYHVNMSEAQIENAADYPSFNEFFIRRLKPNVRHLAQSDIVSPVDGCISEIGAIEDGQLIQAKGRYYSVKELLACDSLTAEHYRFGQFATIYLSPKDYHRVHMPLDAQLVSMTYIPGSLFSVQPSTTRVIPKLFARNERLAIFFETEIGAMAMVMVGATIVGAIGTSWQGDISRSSHGFTTTYPNLPQKKGGEMGYFKLGSTVVLLFANGSDMQWNGELKAGNKIHFGQELGHFCLK